MTSDAGARVRRLLIATTNRDKLAEIRQLLAGTAIELVSLRDRPSVPEPEETGATFEENARLKARYYDQRLPSEPTDGQFTVAEDSGLVIDALNGEPGIHSARFVRPDASYAEKFTDIYRRLQAVPGRDRRARFVCALAVVSQGAVVFETTGSIEGEIAPAPRGTGGFGYDPIFEPESEPSGGRTLGLWTPAEKHAISHRARAARRMAPRLAELGF